MTLTKPSLWPAALAFPEAEKGNVPIFKSYPAFLACSSVKPTEEISGEQYVQPGILL